MNSQNTHRNNNNKSCVHWASSKCVKGLKLYKSQIM